MREGSEDTRMGATARTLLSLPAVAEERAGLKSKVSHDGYHFLPDHHPAAFFIHRI